tara:strand:+ start:29 stop:553 length:525 start_codon:yes stop_codon:yes gene_type:complete
MDINKVNMEEFRQVPGYEGLYEVSNLGRVKSLDKLSYCGRRIKSRFLKKCLCSGYYTTSLYKDGIGTTYRFHQIVAMAFLNHTPCGYDLVVNHINLNKTDNRVGNLEIITARENSNLKHIKSKSKYVGVSLGRGGKWRSVITIKGKQLWLGVFKEEIEASNAYQKRLKQFNDEK